MIARNKFEVALTLSVLAFVTFLAQSAFATGLSAATYVKLSDVMLKTEGGVSMHDVMFKITGGSGDTYTTSGITPSAAATGLGFTGFKRLHCEVNNVAWGSYMTAANAIILRDGTAQLANATSINGTVFVCRGLAYD